MPAAFSARPKPSAAALARRVAVELGGQVEAERSRRGWSLRRLAREASMSASAVHSVIAGEPSSLDGYARLAEALHLEARFALGDDRSPAPAPRDVDAVHAAMGEVLAERLLSLGYEVLMDEPYQHYQHAGRADVIAIHRERRSLLHVEDRTRFPDIQAFAGSFTSKRAYLGADLAARYGIGRGFAAETHVVAALWSQEVLRVLRLRESTFRATCPNAIDRFESWWAGDPPASGRGTTLVVLDPVAGAGAARPRWVGLDQVRTVKPRYQGYADALAALRKAGAA